MRVDATDEGAVTFLTTFLTTFFRGGKEFRDGNGPGPEGPVLGMLATDPENVGESPLIR